jgi:hypothetical protein
LPYVDSQIPWESHSENCPNPVAKRLYIRDYDKKGNQRFVPWGVTCTNCGVILKQSYEHNLTKKQVSDEKFQKEFHERLEKRQGFKDSLFAGPRLSKEEVERRHMRWAKERKIRRRKLQMLGGSRMSLQEVGLRRRVKELKRMYENDCYHFKVLKNMINWDDELVEKFLATRPTLTSLDSVLRCPPLYRSNNKIANRFRGYIPDPNKPGYLKRDRSHYYLSDPNAPYSWRYNPDPNIVGQFEKLVVKEARARQKYMESHIKIHQSKSEHQKNMAG